MMEQELFKQPVRVPMRKHVGKKWLEHELEERERIDAGRGRFIHWALLHLNGGPPRRKVIKEWSHWPGLKWKEKRKFSIAEVKRLGGFPDDFILLGTYAQQWERIGNSVAPPFMAAIATTIRDKIFAKLNKRAGPPPRKLALPPRRKS